MLETNTTTGLGKTANFNYTKNLVTTLIILNSYKTCTYLFIIFAIHCLLKSATVDAHGVKTGWHISITFAGTGLAVVRDPPLPTAPAAPTISGGVRGVAA